MSGYYEFYNGGFFGFAEEGNYVPYSLHYFIPMLLFAAVIALTVIKRKSLQNWKGDARFRYVLSFLIILAELAYYWRIMYVGNEYGLQTLITRLPLQLCQWGAVCAAYMIVSLNDTLFGMNYYISLVGAGIALLVPQNVIPKTGPAYFRYYQFWMEHCLPIYVTVYAMAVHHKKPRYRDVWISFGAMVLLAIPANIANLMFEEADYLYLKTKIPLIPEIYPLKVAVYSIVIIVSFHLLYGAFRLAEHLRKTKR